MLLCTLHRLLVGSLQSWMLLLLLRWNWLPHIGLQCMYLDAFHLVVQAAQALIQCVKEGKKDELLNYTPDGAIEALLESRKKSGQVTLGCAFPSSITCTKSL